MSIEVHMYLNDAAGNFTESAPRPPVPGEENELQSNGGTSTRSSGSHKSHLSGKSHTSGKSGGSHRSEVSPAATPRRSNLDKTVGSLGCSTSQLDCEETEAPLGFEPEGSAANSPPFTENSTPPYLKWAENLTYLLEDQDGVKLFKQFLDQEQCSNTLDFWFACRGLKMVPSTAESKIYSLVKLIYKKYIKADQLTLRPDIRKSLGEKLYKKENINQSIFDEAQREVESSMRNDTYPLFLKSDLYVQYVQTGGESPKSNTSSGSNSVRPPMPGPLPTLHEGEELKPEDVSISSSANTSATLTLTSSSLMATRYFRANIGSSSRRTEGMYHHPHSMSHNRSSSGRAVNPYHTSYAPCSAQDSELQSLSSDALTDDTMSLTDSSVDGRDGAPFGSKKWKHQRKAMHRNAQINKNTELNHDFIPRTERAPKDRNVAETDPKKFAAMLIERLEKVKEDTEKMERVQESIHSMEVSLHGGFNTSSFHMDEEHRINTTHNMSKSSASIGTLGALIATAMADNGEDNAQSILEEHVSRIWDSSAGQSPGRSPGRHSPKSFSPDRGDRGDRSFSRRLPISGPTPNISGAVYKGRHRRKEKDPHCMSTLSFDSGMGEDKSGMYPHAEGDIGKYVHHHHHLHSKDKSRQQLEYEAQQHSMKYYLSDSKLRNYSNSDPLSTSTHWKDVDRGRSRDTKRSGVKKGSDSSSNIDSGVSGVYDISPLQVPNLHDPNNEKVLIWMLENEKVGGSSNTQYSTDNSDKSSSHKRSHKSVSSSASPAQHRQITGRKPIQYNASRSGSLDRSFHALIGADMSGSVLPSQPISQDPAMPLLNPPNPTTQLEEAKRRLEDESKQQHIMKQSKSFGGLGLKDKRSMPPPSYPPPPSRTLPKSIPVTQPLDLSTEDVSTPTKSDRRSTSGNKRPSNSAPSTPGPGSEFTVVGYFFCAEPIPYRTTVSGKNVTLAQFKQLITKKGNYRYFFKTHSDEFGSGVINEEVTDEHAIVPLWEGKVIGKVEKIE